MKKFIIAITAVMLCVAESWAHDIEIDGMYYNLKEFNKTAEVTYRGDRSSTYSNEYSGSVTIPETITYNSQTYRVTSIGTEAFKGCSGLTSVTIPNSVTYIGDHAFYGCSGLTEILVLSNNEEFSSENGVLYNKDKTTLIIYPGGKKDTSFTIPTSVTSIGKYAFIGCSGLTSVTISNSVTFIGENAFFGTGIYNNYSNWDNGVLYIDNCLIKALSDVVKGSYTIKEGTRIIGSSAFYGCSGLTSVTIPNSVTSIGGYAFSDCSGLTSVTIPNSVTSIGRYAFKNCI